MGGVVLVVILLIILGVAVALFLRSAFFAVERTEERLHDPHTPTAVFVVPNGVDPAVYGTALSLSGFTNVIDRAGVPQSLRVECQAGQREQLRQIIENVRVDDWDGSPMELGRVVFADEQ